MGTHFGWGRGGLTLCLACLLLLGAAGSALAHRVNIFAWLEGESVRGECTFHRGAPVRNGTYRVFDQETGRELLRGQTDDEGRFAFTVPAALRQEHGLRIRIQAGDGHQNEWVIEAAEFPSQLTAEKESARLAAPAPDKEAAATAEQGAGSVPPPTSMASAADVSKADSLSREDVEDIVNTALERHLAPLRRSLAAASEAGPSLQDIVGGLGWIMGLAGIALCVFRRRP